MTTETAPIVALLRERVPDIPLHETAEGGPWHEGINVYRFTRPDLPSRTSPYKGTMVLVMYAPEQESERLWPERSGRVREALLDAYGDRYRPLGTGLLDGVLIEDPRTGYSRRRRADYAQRARLGFRALHELGK
jgi:hypothetical protein